MGNKKGFVFSTIGKIIIFIVVLVILVSIFTGFTGKLFDTTIEIFHNEMEDFHVIGGTYVNPSVIGTDFDKFWFKGFQNFIESSITTENQCVGSFYIDDRYNMRGTEISFVNRSDGIAMFLTGNKGVVGLINDEMLKDTKDAEWKLCIIKPEQATISAFTKKFDDAFSNNKAFSIDKSWIQEVHTLVIDMKGKTKNEAIEGRYFTSEKLRIQDQPPERFDYHAFRVVGASSLERGFKGIPSIIGIDSKKYERYHFFFVIFKDKEKKENYFCLLPETRNYNKNKKAFNIEDLEEDMRKQGKEDPFYVDSLSLFCKPPKEGKSVFNGWNSCYYHGCDDIPQDDCKNIYERCKGLCSLHQTMGIKGLECFSCQSISKCKHYNDDENKGCVDNLCDLPCRYDSNEGECVET